MKSTALMLWLALALAAGLETAVAQQGPPDLDPPLVGPGAPNDPQSIFPQFGQPSAPPPYGQPGHPQPLPRPGYPVPGYPQPGYPHPGYPAPPMNPGYPGQPPMGALGYGMGSPYGDPFIRPHRPQSMRDFSWTYIDEPEPEEIKIHDIVTVLVDEKSQVIVDARFNRQRNATMKAELKEFIRLSDAGNLIPSALEQPTADGALTSGMRSTGQMANTEGIQYRIAATVVDVYPNGTIALEARKEINTNKELWEYTLTGIIDSRNVEPGNTCRSEDIADLKIKKLQHGKIFESTKRPWGVHIYDLLSPF